MKRLFVILLAALAFAGCTDKRSHTQAVYVLVDTSGTYTKEAGRVQVVVNYLLGKLNPGDSLAVARVKSRSFTEKDIIGKVSLMKDPLQVNNQKRAFSDSIAKFVKETKAQKGSTYTDITGGLIQAAEFLTETGAGRKTVVIFSDMQEELDYSTKRDIPIKLDGIRIIAVNVTKLDTDNMDPRRYLSRLEWWQKRALAAGAVEWRVVNDLEQLDRIFEKRS